MIFIYLEKGIYRVLREVAWNALKKKGVHNAYHDKCENIR